MAKMSQLLLHDDTDNESCKSDVSYADSSDDVEH